MYSNACHLRTEDHSALVGPKLLTESANAVFFQTFRVRHDLQPAMRRRGHADDSWAGTRTSGTLHHFGRKTIAGLAKPEKVILPGRADLSACRGFSSMALRRNNQMPEVELISPRAPSFLMCHTDATHSEVLFSRYGQKSFFLLYLQSW